MEKDPEKGFLLAKEAVDHNNGRVSIITGLAYYMGEGVEKEVGMALEYFEKAYEMGYEQAETMISAV